LLVNSKIVTGTDIYYIDRFWVSIGYDLRITDHYPVQSIEKTVDPIGSQNRIHQTTDYS